MKSAALLVLFLSACAWAQPLSVYSEFAKIDATGKVTSPVSPREILSPAVARNAWSSFQIVVTGPEKAAWQLYVAQNPENAVMVTLYREAGDRLEKVTQPVPGTGTQVFWMDIFTAANAPVERIKVEPQLHLNEDWVIYPMEARIMDAVAPAGAVAAGTASPWDVMKAVVCGGAVTAGEAPKDPTQGSLRYRNAMQDRALAAKADKAALQERFGPCDAQPAADNPERYLRIRDLLLNGRP
ncbi:MAG: hypothetical protein ABI995_04000 [Acidobacteriota bacterium]